MHRLFDQGHVQITVALACVVLSIVLYGTFRCKTSSFRDPLTTTFAPPPLDKYLDGWGLLHFAMFAGFGYVYPQARYIAFLWCMGVAWEIVESVFRDHPFYLSSCKYHIDTDGGAGWWYGRWQDIVMNTLGLALGAVLARKT